MQVTCARIGTRVYLRRFANILALTVRNTYRGFCLSLPFAEGGPGTRGPVYTDAASATQCGNVQGMSVKVCVCGVMAMQAEKPVRQFSPASLKFVIGTEWNRFGAWGRSK